MARALVLLLALPSLAHGFTDQHCNWGESYWCSSLPQASICSATDHCIDEVWQNLPAPQDHGEVCMICKEMVAKARQLISSNRTKDVLIFLEETSCAFIPIRIIADECTRLVEKYGPQILKLMATNLDPTKICTVIGLCNSVKINILLENAAMEKIEPETEIIDCTQCGEAANLLSNQLAAAQRNKIVDNMLEFCTNVDFPSACEATVLDQFEVLLNEVTGFLDSGVCDHNLICAQDFNAQDDNCQHCEKVVQFYIDVYVKNSSLAEFKMVLDAVCERLNESSVDSCKTVVVDYHRIIYEFLKTSVDPHQVCAIFEVCDHTKQENNIPRIPIQGSKSFVLQNSSSNKDATCILCEDILHELQTYLEDEHTQEEIKEELNKICDIMPRSVRATCHHFIESNEPTLVYFFAHEIDPVYYCKLVHLCSQQASESEVSFHLITTDSSCVFCTYVISALDGLLEDKTNEKEIKDGLDKLCSHLPMFSEQCDSFVEKYTDMIIDMLTHGITPYQLCNELGICSSNKDINGSYNNVGDVEINRNLPAVWKYNETTRLITTDSSCNFCKYVISTLDSILEDKTTEKEIKDALDTLCSYLPMFSEQCDTFVEMYTDMIIDLLTKGTSPEQLCEKMGLCGSITSIRNTEAAIAEDNWVKPHGGHNMYSSCIFCKYVITTLDSILEDKTNEKEIEDALETLCSYLPMFSKQCDSFVEMYTDMIIDLLTKGTSPEQLCEEMGLCAYMEAAVDPHGVVVQERGSQRAGPSCVFCKYVIKTLDNLLEDKTNEKEIKDALEILCSFIPMFSKQCDSFVETYTDMIIDLLTKGTSPEELCDEMGLCAYTEAAVIEDNKIEAHGLVVVERKDSSLSADSSCQFCKYVIKTLDGLLEDKTDEKEIKDTLEKLCSYLPMFSEQCDSFVEKYTDMIIDFLTKGTTPDQICEELGLCSHIGAVMVGNNMTEPHGLLVRDYNSSPLNADSSCEFCKYVIKTLDGLLEDKTDEKEIKDTLEKLCSYLPMFSEQCDSFVEKYTDMIIDLLTKGTTPDQICEELGLCSHIRAAMAGNNMTEPTGLLVRDYNSSPLNADSSCEFCKYVIKTLDGLLEDKTDEKEIKDALERLCSYLPMFSEQCESFVEKYTDLIIDMLTKGTTPDQLCEELGLCGPKIAAVVGSNNVEQQGLIVRENSYTNPLCTLCNYVLEELHIALEDEKNEERIKQTLEVVCYQLIVPIRKQCLRLIKQFQAEIIDLIVKDTAPEMICPAIGVCVDDEIYSNSIPNIDLLPSSANAQGLASGQLRDSGSDKYVDMICKFLRKLIKEKGLDPANLPTKTVAFHKTVLGVTWYGSASVYNGKFAGLSTVHRSGRSSFTIAGNVSTEAAYLSVEHPTAHYSADAEFMGLRVGAGATVHITEVQMYIVADMNLLDHGSRPQINQFQIKRVGDIVVRVEGLGPLNWILDPLATCISNVIKDWIGQMVEGPLREALQEVLNMVMPPA